MLFVVSIVQILIYADVSRRMFLTVLVLTFSYDRAG